MRLQVQIPDRFLGEHKDTVANKFAQFRAYLSSDDGWTKFDTKQGVECYSQNKSSNNTTVMGKAEVAVPARAFFEMLGNTDVAVKRFVDDTIDTVTVLESSMVGSVCFCG